MTDQPAFDFQDGKEPGALRTIGEVARAFGIKQHVLRYWEDQFPMLRPLTRAGGRRYYRTEDIALIERISTLLYQEGYTIRGARLALAEVDPAAPAAENDAGQPEGALKGDPALFGQLRRIRADLARALAAA